MKIIVDTQKELVAAGFTDDIFRPVSAMMTVASYQGDDGSDRTISFTAGKDGGCILLFQRGEIELPVRLCKEGKDALLWVLSQH